MKRKAETREDRITRERRELNLRPWQFAPSEVDGGKSPYTSDCVGHSSWIAAQKMRAEIRARDPHYFDA